MANITSHRSKPFTRSGRFATLDKPLNKGGRSLHDTKVLNGRQKYFKLISRSAGFTDSMKKQYNGYVTKKFEKKFNLKHVLKS